MESGSLESSVQVRMCPNSAPYADMTKQGRPLGGAAAEEEEEEEEQEEEYNTENNLKVLTWTWVGNSFSALEKQKRKKRHGK